MTLLSAAYAAVARARRRFYERHPNRQRCLRQPVISIGNISVGGSGKTPAVAHIAKLLIAAGERPAILTRGYRRQEPTEGCLIVSDCRHILADVRRAGDEPLMLARALPGAAVIVSADRYLSGCLAERRFGCSVHLLDDGFQHVQLHRDVDIVLVAPEDLQGRVLPDGRLREGLDALRRAHAVVVNSNADVDVQTVAEKTGVRAVFRATTRLTGSGMRLESGMARESGMTPIPDSLAIPDSVAVPDPMLAVAGIARPRRFFDLLSESGWRVVRELTFRDHHWFTRADLDRIARTAVETGAVGIVTTEKDLVRLLPLRPFPMPIIAAPLELTIGRAARGDSDPGGADALPFPDWLAARLAARSAAPEHPA